MEAGYTRHVASRPASCVVERLYRGVLPQGELHPHGEDVRLRGNQELLLVRPAVHDRHVSDEAEAGLAPSDPVPGESERHARLERSIPHPVRVAVASTNKHTGLLCNYCVNE